MKKKIKCIFVSFISLIIGVGGLPLLSFAGNKTVVITSAHEARAKAIVEKMTLEEKLDYIGGFNDFSIRAIPRLNLPEIKMADGPQGIRNNTKSTMYPAGILSASTWNRSLVEKLGKGLGQDARARGISFLLGPGVCIYRSPLCGRNFEYFGEDPYLASEVAKSYILGVQSEGVIATIKHFVANNEEWDRHSVSSDVDERTLQEIYFPSFRKAVEQAHVGAVMNSYNLINGVHATENPYLNIETLRNQWGFKGILMSDWVSVYSAVGAANNGLDLEMPNGLFMNRKNLLPAIKKGLVTEKTINLKVQHILQTLIAFGMLEHPQLDSSITKDNSFGKETALALAREGIVLLKNEGNILPLKGNVTVLGPHADKVPTGGGSGFVTPYSTVTVWQGLKSVYKSKANLLPEAMWIKPEASHVFSSILGQGFKAEYFNNERLEGKPVVVRNEKHLEKNWGLQSPAEGINSDHFSVRFTTEYRPEKSGTIKLHVEGDDGYRAFINDKEVVNDWNDHAVTSRDALLNVEAGKSYTLRIEYYDAERDASLKVSLERLDEDALRKYVASSKNVVLCVGFDSSTESEGFDRTFALPGWQSDLISKIADANENVIVVLNAGGGVDFRPWINKVKAVLMAWYPGQEGGQAVAEILSGRLSPSGKLPISMEKNPEDNPTYNSYHDNNTFYFQDRGINRRVEYSEGVFVGYRGYELSGKKPLFPFGYGLSYTDFVYSNLKVSKSGEKALVSFDVKNIGKMAGSEIAQIYVHDVESSVPRPYKELKGYEKVFLKAGETKRVIVELDKEAFSYYDMDKHDFVLESGDFDILVGTSSVDLPLKGNISF